MTMTMIRDDVTMRMMVRDNVKMMTIRDDMTMTMMMIHDNVMMMMMMMIHDNVMISMKMTAVVVMIHEDGSSRQ